jgi:hypothetical protein
MTMATSMSAPYAITNGRRRAQALAGCSIRGDMTTMLVRPCLA